MKPIEPTPPAWEPGPGLPRPGELHVWLVPHGPEARRPERAERILSAAELARAARFHQERHRVAYLTAHTALREVLGSALRCPPASLRFAELGHGKPVLDPRSGADPCPGAARGAGGLHFNLSDTEGLGLVALSVDGPVGVDVERHRDDRTLLELAPRFFSPREVRALEALPEVERLLAFHRIWTRKEAYVKALGLGLSLELSSFDVSHGPGPDAQLLATRFDPAVPACADRERWRLVDLDVGPEHSAAAVVAAPPGSLRPTVRLFRWSLGEPR